MERALRRLPDLDALPEFATAESVDGEYVTESKSSNESSAGECERPVSLSRIAAKVCSCVSGTAALRLMPAAYRLGWIISE